MIKCLVKMKTRCLLLGILYGAGLFNLFSTSHGAATPDKSSEGPRICQQQIITHINNRYASTVVTTRLRNPDSKDQKYTFSFLFPNNAFLTGFVIEVNGNNFTSFVLEDKKARKQFESVGNVSEPAKARNSQKFLISLNLEAYSITSLYLTYEELLIRNHGQYEHVLSIYPGQLVEDLFVEVFLKESSKITNLKIPNLRSGKETGKQSEELDPHAFISEDRHSGLIKVLFIPNEEEQRKYASIMKKHVNQGFAGQFVVQYDVDNHKEFGEIIISNSYFVNFFAPKGLDLLTRHVVFVLDTSGSMQGNRIKHLKQSMEKMLNQLGGNDLISLAEFNQDVNVWNLDSEGTMAVTKSVDEKKMKLLKPIQATPANIKKMIDCVNKFNADHGTDMLSALKVGLKLVELGKNVDKIKRQPLIMFLTDGDPANNGETSLKQIKEEVTKLNQGANRCPISTLGFGESTNQEFLQNLATLNDGLFKHIYDAKDSQLQIQNFFNTISVPVLANVNFKYSDSGFKDMTSTKFPVCYNGSELIITGQYDNKRAFNQPLIEALSANGPLPKQVVHVYKSATEISHLWAFQTTKQLLSTIRTNPEKNPNEIKKVVEVCSKYSFVTPFTSMVIVKPNEKVVMGTAELNAKSTEAFGYITVGKK